ncbi:MAG: T9SS type A sorting domain-containing protein [Bacteroidales bacterium]|nr:T9SS type A sorting domain-containing protein [Bacteroidales bacterium]
MKRFLVFLIAVCFSANAFAQITKQQDNVNIEQIEDENNPVQNLNKIQNNLDYMMLTWDLPQNTSYDEKILSWSDDMLYTICAAGIYEEQEALHYFTSEDVSEYVGWKVKQIAFIPLGTENTHSIVIWEEIDEEKTLVYEQEINNENLAFREWNYIDLDNEFYLENNKNYYIGFSSDGDSNGHWIFPCDNSEPNYEKNWVHVGDTWSCLDLAVNVNLCIKTILENPDGKDINIGNSKNNKLTGYRVYANNEIVKEIKEPYIVCYFDNEFESANDIEYCVTAVYGDVESEPLCVEHVSVDDIAYSSRLEIYPNPANDFVTIKTHNNIGDLITISDISGRTLITEEVTSDDIQINIADLTKGLYIIKVGDKSEKLIIRD